MGRPLLFIDFDGVINQFPDPKVMRRQGTTDWMRPDDPRRAAYAPDNWFRPVLLQCLFDRFGSVFPQCGLMVFPGVVIVSR